VRLVSFNILHGSPLAGGPVSTDDLVAACVSLDADVLCLQEVDRGQARSGGADQAAAIAEAVGAVAWRFEPALVGEPGAVWRAATDDDCETTDPCYGVAVVSRLPVTGWHVVRLPPSPVSSPVYLPGRGTRFIWLADEPRVTVAAEVDAPWGPLLVASTHLSFVPGWNLHQLRRLTGELVSLAGDRGCVMMGDLNVPNPFSRAAPGWRSLARARTFPASRPAMQIDHALGRGRLPEVVGFKAVELPVSDHRALVVDFAGRPAG
jgi:endonuclease/exonuclease/phosphatase family metal-dependent hydrolase